MVEICEECNQCVPNNGICLSCGKEVFKPERPAINFSNEENQYEGNE